MVEDQAKPFGMAERSRIVVCRHGTERLGHAIEAEVIKLIERGMGKHVFSFSCNSPDPGCCRDRWAGGRCPGAAAVGHRAPFRGST